MVNLDSASTIKISLNDLQILLADDAQTTRKTISNRAKILRENGIAHVSENTGITLGEDFRND